MWHRSFSSQWHLLTPNYLTIQDGVLSTTFATVVDFIIPVGVDPHAELVELPALTGEALGE